MKNLSGIILLLLMLGSFGYLLSQNDFNLNKIFFKSQCDQVVRYSIGKVDPKFNIKKEEFLKDVGESADIWNQFYGKKLFEFDPGSDFSINLVYDERQSLHDEISQIKNKLDQKEEQINPKISQYEAQSEDFKKRVSNLNSRISYWNSRGGAPEEEYKKLVEEQNQLKDESDRLNALAKELNQSTQDYNLGVNKLNQSVVSFNSEIKQRPEEGLYDPKANRIDIYFNFNQAELIHTLTHELGHSLGIKHNSNPLSIMYPYTSKTTTLSTEDKIALNQACKYQAVWEILGDRALLYLDYYLNPQKLQGS